MNKINNQEEVIDLLVQTYSTERSDNRANLILSKRYLHYSFIVYDIYARKGLLHSIEKNEYISHSSCGIKDKSVFEYFYKRFRDEGLTRPYYMDIKDGKLCTYCVYKEAEQADYYLPQSIYPSYSLILNNMIPICGTCNNIKRTQVPLDEEWFFHPYFDFIEEQYLDVDIDFIGGAFIKFSVPVYQGKSDLVKRYLSKLDYSLKKLNLYKKFSSLADSELKEILRIVNALKSKNDDSHITYLKTKLDITIEEGMLWKISLYREVYRKRNFLTNGYRYNNR